jgi:iron(III) transport system permease protein
MLLVGYVGHFLPFAIRAVDVSIQQIGRELEEAANVFGNGRLRTFLYVSLPLMRPGMIAGWSLLAILMLRELPISALVYTPETNVIAVLFYNLWENGSLPRVAAFAVILVGLSLATVLSIRIATRRVGIIHAS